MPKPEPEDDDFPDDDERPVSDYDLDIAIEERIRDMIEHPEDY
jgi:hypothetical protein